jgi:FixJ family two-component response regulator
MSGRKEEVTEKISEPFQYFEFIEKPFEKKQLIDAIKSAFQKATLPRPDLVTEKEHTPTPTQAPAATHDPSADIAALKAQMAKMQAEIEGLKKQVLQIKTYIQKKLK